jgi:hypothetical protein
MLAPAVDACLQHTFMQHCVTNDTLLNQEKGVVTVISSLARAVATRLVGPTS